LRLKSKHQELKHNYDTNAEIVVHIDTSVSVYVHFCKHTCMLMLISYVSVCYVCM